MSRATAALAAALFGAASLAGASPTPTASTCAAPGTTLYVDDTLTFSDALPAAGSGIGVDGAEALFVGALATTSAVETFDSGSGPTNLGGSFGTATYSVTTPSSIFHSNRALNWAVGTQIITFSEPQQAVGFSLYGVDNCGAPPTMTITCANGAVETLEYTGPADCGSHPAYYSTVRNAADPGDFCVRIEISSAGSDGLALDNVRTGTCDAAPADVFSAPCDCGTTEVSSAGSTVGLVFSEDGPYDAECA